jgi:hypothetical protein
LRRMSRISFISLAMLKKTFKVSELWRNFRKASW